MSETVLLNSLGLTALIISAIISAILSVTAFLLAIKVFIELRAMQNSTHQIQYMPAPFPDTKTDASGFEEIDDELKEKFKDQETDYESYN